MSNSTAVELFTSDLRVTLRKQPPQEGYNHPAAEALGLTDLLIAVMNWRIRLISPRRREVYVSTAMQAQPEVAEHREVLDEICQKLVDGIDVLPYLSKKANSIMLHREEESPGRRKKRQQKLDGMLYDWGVYHMHLSTKPDPKDPRYMDRSGPLLFALVSSSHALLIGIFKHEEWAREDVAEVIVNEWPEHSRLSQLRPGIEPVTVVPPDAWQQMRKSGVNVIRPIDGNYYISMGVSLDGGSLKITDEANNMVVALKQIDERVAVHGHPYRAAKQDGWYGLEGPDGFQRHVPFPWWHDGENWRPTP